MDENTPQQITNQQLFSSRPSRTFGSAVQMSAVMDGQHATIINWSQTCQSLQEKINMLAFEVNQLRAQNIEFNRRDSTQGMRIWELEAEVEWLRLENQNLSNRKRDQPSTSSSTSPPGKISRITIDLSDL